MYHFSKLSVYLSLSLILCLSGFSQSNDVVPRYVEGKDALIKHISEHLALPEECLANNQEGTAYVSIHVNTSGEIDKMEIGKKGHIMPKFWLSAKGMPYPTPRPIVEGPSIHFDRAVASALEGLGKFRPAVRDGQLVDSWLTFPVFFDVFCCSRQTPISLSVPRSTP